MNRDLFQKIFQNFWSFCLITKFQLFQLLFKSLKQPIKYLIILKFFQNSNKSQQYLVLNLLDFIMATKLIGLNQIKLMIQHFYVNNTLHQIYNVVFIFILFNLYQKLRIFNLIFIQLKISVNLLRNIFADFSLNENFII